MAETVTLILNRKYTPYNAGERAGWPAEEAHELVRQGVARYANPEDAPEPPTDPGTKQGASGELSTHDLTVTEVEEAVEGRTFDELQALLTSELNHPDYESGRSTALAAIRDAIEAVDA